MKTLKSVRTFIHNKFDNFADRHMNRYVAHGYGWQNPSDYAAIYRIAENNGVAHCIDVKGQGYGLRTVSRATGYRMWWLVYIMLCMLADRESFNEAIEYVKAVSCEFDW